MRRNFRDIKADPTAIGDVAKPPFARLPDPQTLFAERAARYRALAEGHELGRYLTFLADLTQAQHDIQNDLPEPAMLDADVLARAKEHAMPPLDRNQFSADAAFDATFDRLLGASKLIDMPEIARTALDRVANGGLAGRDAMVLNVLADAIPAEAMAEHVFAAAAMQVHFARLAARLPVAELVAVGDGVCPCCGGAPVASMIVGWPGAHGTRFCACSLCGTLWNQVRIKCMLCGATKGVTYREIEEGPGTIKAETCESCHGYLKILQQQKDPDLDPIADDVASLGLDLLVRELGFRRGGINPFLLGY